MIPGHPSIDAPTGEERRAQRRFDTIAESYLVVLSRGGEHLARVTNFSLGGLGIELDAELAPDSEIAIDHPVAGRMIGTCRWRGERLTGFAFGSVEDSVSLCSHFLKQMVPDVGIAPALPSTTWFR